MAFAATVTIATTAFAGGVLNIKPVLSVIDGEINMLGKARGSKMGNNLLVQEIEKAGGVDFSKPVKVVTDYVYVIRRWENAARLGELKVG